MLLKKAFSLQLSGISPQQKDILLLDIGCCELKADS